MARVKNQLGLPIVQNDVASISYTVYALDARDPDKQTPVEGHEDVPLDKAEVVFDELQPDDRWKADELGYNFAHTINVNTQSAFRVRGADYLVVYSITPVSGQAMQLAFNARVI